MKDKFSIFTESSLFPAGLAFALAGVAFYAGVFSGSSTLAATDISKRVDAVEQAQVQDKVSCLTSLQSIDHRLSLIEGRLGVRK